MLFVQKDQTYGSLQFPKIDLNDQIKGVLLDIDNTLYSYDICHSYAMSSISDFLDKQFDIDENIFLQKYKDSRNRVAIDLNGQGASHSRLLYFQKMLEKILNKTCVKTSLQLEKLYWDTFFEKMILDKKASKFINKCNELDIKICIITDLTAKIQMEKILKLGIADKINYLVSSEEAGVEKPHPYIFKLGLEKLQLNPNEVIVVGDNEKKDIKGADILDIKSVFVGVH